MTGTPAENHRWARIYGDAGAPVFALPPNQKKPFPGSKGCKDATTDRDTIDRMFAGHPDYNVAIATNDDFGVGDLDVKTVDGIAEWNRLSVENGTPQGSPLTAETCSGGRHVYMSNPTGLTNSASRIGPGIDFRGVGGYVVAPPSVVDGKAYRWITGGADIADALMSLPPVPQWVVAKYAAQMERRKAADDAGDKADQPRAITLFKQHLSRNPIPPEGEGSDEATWKAMARGFDLGLRDETLMAIIAAATGFDDDWLWEKLVNAEKYKQNEWGCDIPTNFEKFAKNVSAFKQAAGVTDETDSATDTFEDGCDLLNGAADTAPDELVEGIIEKGIANFLSGRGGVGKGIVALQLAASVHTGRAVFGHEVEQATLVHVSYENGRKEDARRLRRWVDAEKLPDTAMRGMVYRNYKGSGPLFIVDGGCNVVVTPLWQRLEAKVRSIPGHKLIMFDSLYNLFQFDGNSKVNETAVQGAIDFLDNLMVDLDATGLVVCHPSEAGAERADMSGWSVAWHNRPRNRLGVREIKDMPGSVELVNTKRNNAAKSSTLTLHMGAGLFVAGADNAEANKLYRACVEVAKDAVNGGIPVKNETKGSIDYRRAVEAKTGILPAPKKFIGLLNRAVTLGVLEYRKHNDSTRERAGYYPTGKDEDGEEW